jgi:hypothetical protein
MVQIRFPTRVASIVGRWACEGPDDLSRVRALQAATTLTVQDTTPQRRTCRRHLGGMTVAAVGADADDWPPSMTMSRWLDYRTESANALTRKSGLPRPGVVKTPRPY